ncbi:hypothetical protein AVEN_261669-1 [Araneus ventricosus]|uniref:Uncharacterized protein n=1 Tax=Araneus ventricosus TaxID=182803 RepID=A0A4Y2DW29_ARAVE|nr:hypothetical protein AVEN_261669-1 [Araneus ventricosus]
MATPATSVCFICNKSLSEGAVVTVKKRGIETLTKSSVLRMLPDHTDLLKDLNEIVVHRGCQKTYTNSGMIAASINLSFSTTSFNHKFSNKLLFIHAISGCDTTSTLFGQGKNKCISLFVKHEELLNTAATFLNPQATTEQVTEAGENVLVALYGGDPATQSLDELRYHSFVKAAAKTKFNLARLPPTTDAAQLHAMRSYHQCKHGWETKKIP